MPTMPPTSSGAWNPSHCPDPVAAGGQTKTKAQLAVIKGLIKQADCVVNAGDPDREGQLLVDEVIDFLGYPKTKPVQRCLISDLNPPPCAAPSTSSGTTRSSCRWRCRRWPVAVPTGSMAST